MSADEIKALAQQAFVDGMANHHAGLLKTESRCKQYAAALLDYAAMVERCEKKITYLESIRERGDTEVIDMELEDTNYILKGATDGCK